MGPVPTVEELGAEDLVPAEAPETGTPGGRVWSQIADESFKGASGAKVREEYKAFNGMLFLTFVLPTAFAAAVWGAKYALIPYSFVIVWVHEAGHGFWCLISGRFLCSFAGFLNEMLFTLVPALICMRSRPTYFAAVVLLMCVGFSMEHNGVYMQSAENPSGTSFAGALTHRYNDMSRENHDWSIIFRTFGVVEHAYGIGKLTEELGQALAAICFFAALLGFIPMLNGAVPKNMATLISPGGVVAAAYFAITGWATTQIIVSLLAASPLIMAASKRFIR